MRDDRMYEVPPPPPATEEDPRVRQRRVAATLGEALEVEPYTWQGALVAGDRIGLVSRHFAHTVGVDELKSSLAGMRPGQAVEHLQQVFAIRGGSGSDGMLAIEIAELAPTATVHQLEPVRPAEPLAGLPDQSPVPLADAIGRGLHRAGDAAEGARAAVGRGVLTGLSWILAFVPRRQPEYPRTIPRTSEREHGRRRRVGLAGMVVVAGILAVGATVAALPGGRARPTPFRAPRRPARRSTKRSTSWRKWRSGSTAPTSSTATPSAPPSSWPRPTPPSSGRRASVWPPPSSRRSAARIGGRLDALYRVARIERADVVVDLAAAFDDVEPVDMVAASDGSFWILETRAWPRHPRRSGRRLDDRSSIAPDRSSTSGDVPAEPWLIATAATDVVVIDRDRTAWRIDLAERIPRAMEMNGVADLERRDDAHRRRSSIGRRSRSSTCTWSTPNRRRSTAGARPP